MKNQWIPEATATGFVVRNETTGEIAGTDRKATTFKIINNARNYAARLNAGRLLVGDLRTGVPVETTRKHHNKIGA